MQHLHLMNQARQHWQEFQPSRFQALTENGQLEAALRQAAELTLQEVSRLIDCGLTAGDAWMEARELHLFPSAEPAAAEEPGPSDGYLFYLILQRQLREFNDI